MKVRSLSLVFLLFFFLTPLSLALEKNPHPQNSPKPLTPSLKKKAPTQESPTTPSSKTTSSQKSLKKPHKKNTTKLSKKKNKHKKSPRSRRVRLPPSSIKTVKPLKKIPPSFHNWWRDDIRTFLSQEEALSKKREQFEKRQKEKQRDAIRKRREIERTLNSIQSIYVERTNASHSDSLNTNEKYLTDFVTNTSLKTIGTILFDDSNSTLSILFEGQQASARITDPNTQVNDELTLFRSQHRGILWTSRHVIEIIGIIKVISEIQGNIYRIRITKAFQPIKIGEKITDYSLKKIQPSIVEDTKTTLEKKTHILDLPSKESNLLNVGAIVFLNRGIEDGVREAQTLAIHQNMEIRTSRFVSNVGPLIGWLKVVDVSKKFSTAVIVESNKVIHKGDLVGLPHFRFIEKNELSSKSRKQNKKSLDKIDLSKIPDEDEFDELDEFDEEASSVDPIKK